MVAIGGKGSAVRYLVATLVVALLATLVGPGSTASAVDDAAPAAATEPASQRAPATPAATTINTAGLAGAVGAVAAALNPRVVEVFGDSILWRLSTGWLGTRLAQKGAQGILGGAPATGPLDYQGAWLTYIWWYGLVYRPNVLIIGACCAYGVEAQSLSRDNAGRIIYPGSESMYDYWELVMFYIALVATYYGARVYIHETPTPVPGSYYDLLYGQMISRLNESYRKIADLVPNTYLMKWDSFLTYGGQWVYNHPTYGNVRQADGEHLTDTSQPIAADYIIKLLYG
ncbi:MAG: hypothetical protein JJLCMIEE_00800 [Acidimicrobiales bacterium]|nr:MAG: hypothetical protein EDR02_03015 [Actinomycetota bacterium]MBV6507744.1 hypothetical protein [Acidimicrobiales bacterium]RIK07668.1 MAG: hypothetical protein DCC48_04030 [Acidobacteriota bacterium]